MPVPETRRYGGREESSYTSSYGTRSSAGRSYLSPSTYTSSVSKFTSSSLPPRPPVYERKYSDNISTMPTSRFLSSSSSATRQYGTTSSTYGRSSPSPVRAMTERFRTPSVTDRVKSLEPDSVPTRYSRLRETSHSVNSKGPSTYTGYTRDRSGSRELGTSPLSGSAVSLASREYKSRSNSIGPSSASSTSTSASPSARGVRNGTRLSPVEVSQSNESPSCTSTTTTSATATTTTATPNVKSGSSGSGSSSSSAPEKCKDVENNDSSFSDDADASELASGTPTPTTIITTTTTSPITTTITSSAAASASSPSQSNNHSQSSSNSYMNGNGNGNGDHNSKVERRPVGLGLRRKIITSTPGAMNQDKNGNPIGELVNGHGELSPPSCSGDSNNTNNFNSKTQSEETSAPKLTSTSKLNQTQSVRQPKVIYHKIHIVKSEDSEPTVELPPTPPPEKAIQQNGESTAVTVGKCHGNGEDARMTANDNSITMVPIVEINHVAAPKKNSSAVTAAGTGNPAVSTKFTVTQTNSSPPPPPPLPPTTNYNTSVKSAPARSRNRSKSPSPVVEVNRNQQQQSQPTRSRSSTPTGATGTNKSSSPIPNGEGSNHVGEMAGPHATKYKGQDEVPGTSGGAMSTRRVGDEPKARTYESDSSENDSDAYTSSPQLGGRFRTRDKDSAQSGLTGLRNIGNTCFMNSVLQCLSNTKPLLEYLLTDNYISDINSTSSSMKGALIRAFANVIQELWRESRTVDTSAFKDQIQRFAPRFMGYSQQDAQEFLRYLLEGLHEEINRVTQRPKPILTDIDESLSDAQKAMESWKRYLRGDDSKIVDIFVGQFKSTLKCTTCGHCSVTFDPFWDLSLPIPSRSNSSKLSQCLELFTREETLDGDEKPTCAKCQTRRKCTKSLSIQRFPKVLVIHLKRFAPSERFRGKLSTTVEYPLNGLDMTPYAANRAQGCSYNLYGISNHSGSTYSGHYIAYCKHPKTGEWHTYNDSRVTSISSQSVAASEGYVLFYELANQSSHL